MDLVYSYPSSTIAIPSSPSDPRIWTRKHIQLVVNYRINLYKLQVEDIHNSRETLEFRGMMRKMSAISKQKSANKSKLPSLVQNSRLSNSKLILINNRRASPLSWS